MKHLSLATLLICIAHSAVAGEIYSWKDKSGRVHYSDTPPANADAQSIKAPSTPAGVGSTTKALQESNRSSKEKQDQRNAAEKKIADEKARQDANKAYCQSIKDRIAVYEEDRRIRVRSNGEDAYVSDETRAAELGKMKSDLAKDCKGM